jgi:predicted AlkP superfamily phosphohydrolase/phosphomutase
MILVNVPITYPPPPVNGIVISGLMTPNNACNFVHPPEMRERLLRDGYRVDFHPLADIGSRRREEWLHDYFDIEERRLETARRLIREEPWDVFMIVVGVTDRIQHFCWSDLAEPPEAGPIGGPVARAYEVADRVVGALAGQVDDQTLVLVVSDHGFGIVDHVFFTNRWLRDNGFLALKAASLTRWQETHALQWCRLPVRALLERFGLASIAPRLPAPMADAALRLPLFRRRVSASVVDWSRTRAYADAFGIYVNRKGRETRGIVASDQEYERVRDEIIARLGELRDRRAGGKLVDVAVRREEVYTGDHLASAPDILFRIRNLSYLLNRSFYFRRLAMRVRTGNHRMEGILIATGRGVRGAATVDGAAVVDLAPTILHALGLGVPDDMDGEVLASAFTHDYMQVRPITRVAPLRIERKARHDVYTTGELDEIRAALVALGYLS